MKVDHHHKGCVGLALYGYSRHSDSFQRSQVLAQESSLGALRAHLMCTWCARRLIRSPQWGQSGPVVSDHRRCRRIHISTAYFLWPSSRH